MKFLSTVWLLAGMLATAIPLAQADQKAPMPVAFAASESHLMKAQSIDQVFKIDVALPYSYSQGGQDDRTYPVVYVTDGGGNFPIVVGSQRMLTLGQELPEMIVVGIGYDTRDISRIMAIRTRDLTPTADQDRLDRALQEPGTGLPSDVHHGGAEAFTMFIDKELKPFINDRYNVDVKNETYVGYSLGGLFGLYLLFNHDNAFDRYVIGSPSIWWDNGVSFEYEANYAEGHKDMAKRVFLSVGGLEEPAGSEAQMVTNMVNMYGRLQGRNYAGLALKHHIFEGETHMSSQGTAFNRGLRFVFGSE